MKASISTSAVIIHNGHVAKEIAFQELIRNKAYENIPVKDLKDSAALIAGSILNYLSKTKDNLTGDDLITDSDAYDTTYWRNKSLRRDI